MPILNKDGSEYKLSRPNELMATQNVDSQLYVLHNFEKQSIIKKQKSKSKLEKGHISNVQLTKLSNNDLSDDNNLFKTLNCLPSETTRGEDTVYGEAKYEISYKDPEKIQAIISHSSDIVFQFWTQSKIEKESIIHQPLERRWWLVKEITEREGWYNYSCIPSQVMPYFAV